MAYRHASGYQRLDDCTIVACADIVRENAEAFAVHNDIDGVYEDHEAMLEEAEPDIVSVCVPPAIHADLVVDSAEAPSMQAVHCEKPMATTWGDCKRMASVCEREGVQLTIDHQRRLSEPVRRAKSMLDSGRIGRAETTRMVGGEPLRRGSASLRSLRPLRRRRPCGMSSPRSIAHTRTGGSERSMRRAPSPTGDTRTGRSDLPRPPRAGTPSSGLTFRSSARTASSRSKAKTGRPSGFGPTADGRRSTRTKPSTGRARVSRARRCGKRPDTSRAPTLAAGPPDALRARDRTPRRQPRRRRGADHLGPAGPPRDRTDVRELGVSAPARADTPPLGDRQQPARSDVRRGPARRTRRIIPVSIASSASVRRRIRPLLPTENGR
ncbi:Gfo/Idh/MocA family protein [Halorubrum sp. Eb13]|uniref:Gfo/Idh/MocA family protein n=1 Tax=Halorubrum sp. Eb13 TaxID=1383843 RepID=UPI0020CDB1A8|nr:Gfo/Idh/MocA family oxidoreductase [Halorubrum sp. Eb13]